MTNLVGHRVQNYEIGCTTTEMADNKCCIATYNMHGMNTGRSGLVDLCNNPQIKLIAVQEHWLTPSNIHLLNSIHPEFVGFGISAVTSRLGTEVYCGRPYGGVGFLWHKSLCHTVIIGAVAESGRCLSVEIELDSREKINVITVYFPCYNSSVQYSVDLAECLAYIEDVVSNGLSSVLLGDLNFPCDGQNEGYRQCYSVLSRYNIYHCDEFLGTDTCYTYYNCSLHQSSFIDHMFVSDVIRNDIINASEVK